MTTTEKSYSLHEYAHRFDAGLAQMWNESDDQWPGTFTDGVPLTDARVAEWMDRVEAIIKFIVVENGSQNGSGENTNKVVGYGDLWNTAVRPGSAYVALLNVHPEHQGNSLARRMLVRMVNWAVENNYDRITIGTWPANLKAMPLYKKVGFFWKPGTSVRMENYLPAVRLHPLAQEYFNKHDWYKTYRRDLKQVEDEMRHPCTGNLKVYILRWEDDGDMIEAVFDRNAQTLTGFETNAWAAYARAGEGEPAQGVSYPFEWEIVNKSNVPLPVTIAARGEEGIQITNRKTFTLQPGERKVTQATYRVAPDAPKYRDHEDLPTPKITTKLEIGGQTLELGTGLRYHPAVEFSLHPQATTLLPGKSQTVHLQLRNRAKLPLTGQATLNLPEGLTADWTSHEFTAPAEGFAGIPLTITAKQGGFFPLEVQAMFEDAGSTITTQPKRLPVVALAPGSLAAGEGDKELILENDYFHLTAKAKGGELEIWNKATGRQEAQLMEEIGPAFRPWDLHEQEYDLHLHTPGDGTAKAIMTVRSTRFPGFVVGREISINASPLFQVRNWVSNKTNETREGLQVCPFFLVRNENDSTITVPLRERLIHEHASQYSTAESDLPKEPERYAEDWLAYERLDNALAVIWPAKGIKQIDAEWGRHFFYFDLPALAPNETRHLAPLHFYVGPGSWQTVQNSWRQLRGTAHERFPDAPPDNAQSNLNISFEPGVLITLGNEITADLQISTTRDYKLTGDAAIHPPSEWNTDPDRVTIPNLDRDTPIRETVTLSAANPRVGAYAGDIRFQSQLIDRVQPFTILHLGDTAQSVTLETFEQDGFTLWQMDNGHHQWTLAPAYHGGIIAWHDSGQHPEQSNGDILRLRKASAQNAPVIQSKDAEQGTNHLLTSFPEDGELSWMKPFFGGIRPILHQPDEGGWPGKLHTETFTASPVEAPDKRGLPWKGLRVTTELTREAFRGLRVELDYLTLPGSNVLKAVFRLVNETPIYRAVQPGFLNFFQVDGTHKNSALYTPDFHRKRTPHMSWGVSGPWAVIQNPDTGRAIVTINPAGWKRIVTMDWGSFGVHMDVHENTHILPESTYELTAYFALANSVEEAMLYGTLDNQ